MTRFIEPFFQPLGILWVIHLLGFIWMVRQRKWREAFFCGFIAAGISLIGTTQLPTRLLATLERPFQRIQSADSIPPADAIVMLGGVLNASSSDTLGFDFGDGADRVITATALFKENKAGVLVLGGGGGRWKRPPGELWQEGEVLKPWLNSLGIASTNVLHLGNCSNTRDEAIRVAALAKERNWRRVLLVTSAYHMKRASALFKESGVPVEPVGCDFVGLSSLENQQRFSIAPKLERFYHLQLYIHEWVGWFYYRARGWVGSAPAQ